MRADDCTDRLTHRFLLEHEEVCAAHCIKLGPLMLPFTARQLIFYALLFFGCFLFFLWDWKVFYTLLTFFVCAAYALVIVFRLFSVQLAVVKGFLGRPDEHIITPEQVAALDHASLPVYTILVPMYKEPEVAQKIARAVTELDYPIEKLDVKLLLEEDDPETRSKVEEIFTQLPPCVEVIVCPSVSKGEPRTKPRACNWGLERARGDYLVIFDAEDRPDRDQLKKAIVVFQTLKRTGKDKVACLQAKLNYFNARQNALTKFFTLEYSNWFDLFLPGLHALRSPIPLGGTSNHFKMHILKEMGGWDPFNVTEDCDLGIRMARQGYSTEVLDSTTWEEANSRVGNWIRQRSRWIKGYFQTHLVHTRNSFIPPFLLAGFFYAFAILLGRDLQDPALIDSYDYSSNAQITCWILCAASLGLGLWALVEWIRGRFKSKNREGTLGPYDALTFRLTVGGLSTMMLFNFIFWILSALYLFHEPIANMLPEATDQIVINGETPRELLKGWNLYYTNVTEDRHQDRTIWDTSYDWFVRRTLSWEAAKEIYGAIDIWSFFSQILYPVVIGLFLANIVFVVLALFSCAKRDLWDLAPFALLFPFYWILISIAAFKGAFQLFHSPWYWEKTTHGFAQPPLTPDPPTSPPTTPATGTAAG